MSNPPPMLVMFAPVPSPEGFEIGTTIATANTEKIPPKHKADEERGPIITALAPEATTSQAATTGMISVSTTSIHAMT